MDSNINEYRERIKRCRRSLQRFKNSDEFPKSAEGNKKLMSHSTLEATSYLKDPENEYIASFEEKEMLAATSRLRRTRSSTFRLSRSTQKKQENFDTEKSKQKVAQYERHSNPAQSHRKSHESGLQVNSSKENTSFSKTLANITHRSSKIRPLTPKRLNKTCSNGTSANSFLSPTRYDVIEDDFCLSNCSQTVAKYRTSQCEAEIKENLHISTEKKGKRLSLDLGQVLRRNRAKETGKSPQGWGMKIWSHRRNTIESERRSPSKMLKISSSNRLSLRQKSPSRKICDMTSLSENDADSLLAILQQPAILQDFRLYLQTEHSEENLDFWLECEQYRNIKPSRRKKMAAKIYATYLDAQAPKEINVDAGTKLRAQIGLSDPKENTFEEAQKHIYGLMENDSYRRFLLANKPSL